MHCIYVHLKLRTVHIKYNSISLSLYILCIYNIIYKQILHITYILDNRHYMSLIIIIIYYYRRRRNGLASGGGPWC